MKNVNIALGIACLALAACSSGGSVPASTQPTAAKAAAPATSPPSSGGSSVASAGKAAVTISFQVPPKGTSSAANRRNAQYISPSTTQVDVQFISTTNYLNNTYASGLCSAGTCSVQIFVAPDVYNVFVAAEDAGYNRLSIGQSSAFSVVLGTANALPLVFTPVLATFQLVPSTVTAYNGQVTPITVTANLLDADSNPLPQVTPLVDYYGTAVTGIAVAASGAGLTGGSLPAATPVTSVGQVLNFSYAGSGTLPGNPLTFTPSIATGSISPLTSVSTAVASPFTMAFIGSQYLGSQATYGYPLFTSLNGATSIEYPAPAPTPGGLAQSLTLTDLNTAPNNPITFDPAACTAQISSFTANGTPYVIGSPIPVTYASPIPITYTANNTTAGNCTINIHDFAGNTNNLTLYFDKNQIYVTGKKRTK